jgi:hypothetical protein
MAAGHPRLSPERRILQVRRVIVSITGRALGRIHDSGAFAHLAFGPDAQFHDYDSSFGGM